MVGHEIAHALQEHGRERVGKMRLAQIGTVIASVGGALLGFGDLGGQVASGAAQLTLLKYGREDETEADAIGLDLAARAGFDPRAGLVVWEKMSALAKGQPPQWLSSHPSHATRISRDRQATRAGDAALRQRSRQAARCTAALPIERGQAHSLAVEGRDPKPVTPAGGA